MITENLSSAKRWMPELHISIFEETSGAIEEWMAAGH